jgi:hypothetical protein
VWWWFFWLDLTMPSARACPLQRSVWSPQRDWASAAAACDRSLGAIRKTTRASRGTACQQLPVTSDGKAESPSMSAITTTGLNQASLVHGICSRYLLYAISVVHDICCTWTPRPSWPTHYRRAPMFVQEKKGPYSDRAPVTVRLPILKCQS